MEAASVPEFRARINAHANEVLEPDQLRPRLRIDGILNLKHDHARSGGRAQRHGARSAWPTRGRSFTRCRCEIVDGPRPLKDRHLKMTFRQDGRSFRAIAWRAAERAAFLTEHRAGVNLAFSLDQNEFQGETYLELTVADFKSLSDL